MKVLFGLFLISLTAFASDDHVGEKSVLMLNRANSSSVIQTGRVDAEITAVTPTNWQVQADCDFKILFVGRLHGTQVVSLPLGLLDGSLLDEIRSTGSYNTDKFKVTHQGFENVTVQTGATYANADKLYVYDVVVNDDDTDQGCLQRTLVAMAKSVSPEARETSITDLTITAWIAQDQVPVAGLVRANIAGKVNGNAFKIGLDYTP